MNFPFLDLPQELQFHVISTLTYASIPSLSRVCSDINGICMSDELWRLWLLRDMHLVADDSARAMYQELRENCNIHWCDYCIIKCRGMVYIMNDSNPEGVALAFRQTEDAVYVQTKARLGENPQWRCEIDGKLTPLSLIDERIEFPRSIFDSVTQQPKVRTNLPAKLATVGNFHLDVNDSGSQCLLIINNPVRTAPYKFQLTDTGNGWIDAVGVQGSNSTIWTIHDLTANPPSAN
eukprot:TRINITY_DN2106_c0_g1_i3.p2 TRINITY_DN2106_c0_g1~~TRINITY_DN2106_c0_g1_i3.p2  ORF type:complete len:235 (+),score=29.49 TRINITY_DN2106_c0_g1_i3:144-848(+)